MEELLQRQEEIIDQAKCLRGCYPWLTVAHYADKIPLNLLIHLLYNNMQNYCRMASGLTLTSVCDLEMA